MLTQKNPEAETARPAPTRIAGRTVRARSDTVITPAMLPATAGSIHSAASKGVYPRTVWMYVTASRPMPAVAKTTVALARMEALKAARAKSRTSIMGRVVPRCWRTKTAVRTTPIVRMTR